MRDCKPWEAVTFILVIALITMCAYYGRVPVTLEMRRMLSIMYNAE